MSTALPVHPVTGLTALGVTSRGPIWPQLGGDGTGDGNTGDAPPAAGSAKVETAPTGAPEPTAEREPEAAATGDPKPTEEEGKPSSTAPKRGGNSTAEDPKVREARNEAKAARKQFDDLKEMFGKAFGFVADESEADPAKLAARVQASAKEAREAQSELAVFRAAPKDVDTQALVDSRSFARALHKLDLTADDFDQSVADLIAEHVEKHPKFKLAAAPAPKPPARSGADTGSGSGESGQLTYEQYKAMLPQERVKAVKDGRANHILGRTK
ncbi:prolipoprotein diacylglyceryl transferase [Nocardia puris]|uniref:hypothetical protein n=1 Tax=Nocardia puris TaxID=208602 RepID=UPI002E1E5271